MKTIKMIMDVPIDVYTRFVTLSLGTPLNEVLDNIRAEIETEYQKNDATRCEEYDDGYCLGLQTALKIIDNYTNGEGE